ncbi:WhiB family transcriptional regulator [Streptomyces sp. NPDC001774]
MTTAQTPAPGMTTPLPGAGTNWQEHGLCRQVDPDLFFPEFGTAASARSICTACEVRLQCLEYAIAHGEHGVWGATTDDQRREIRRTRDAAARRNAA